MALINQQKALQENIEAIKVAIEVGTQSQRRASEDQLRILNLFKGWGGIKALLYPIPIDKPWAEMTSVSKSDMDMEEKVKEFHRFLKEHFTDKYKEVVSDIKEAILTSFYTPSEIPKLIFEEVYKNSGADAVHSFLDPCAGSGIYIDAFLSYYPKCERVVGVEKDFLTGLILSAKYKGIENVTIYNGGFEEVNFKEEKFDIIASNIPFGSTKINYSAYPEKITNKIHNFFFYHSKNLLNEGGFLSFITSTGVFNSKSNDTVRSAMATGGRVLNLLTLPDTLFLGSGTEVSTHIFNYEKNEKYTSPTIENVVEDENGITLNGHIFKYKNDSFLAEPKIGTNPYGVKEYNYKMPLDEVVKVLRERLFVPKLQIDRPIFINKDERLSFYEYPSYYKTLNEAQTIAQQQEFLREEMYVGEEFRLVGAIRGLYKGRRVPIAVLSKIDDNSYVFQYFIRNNVFKTLFLPIEKREGFKSKYDSFLKELSALCDRLQMKVDIDFKRTLEGINFYRYFNRNYRKPTLHSFYVSHSDMAVAYHRDIIKGDLSINEKQEISIVEEVYNFSDRENIYKLERIDLREQDALYLKGILSVYNALNILNNSINSARSENKEEESSISKDIDQKVNALNSVYDSFVAQFGYINNLNYTTGRIGKYVKPYISILKALENATGVSQNLFEQSYEKSDIFSYQYQVEESKELPLKSALIKVLRKYKNKIDIEDLEKFSGKSREDVLEGLKDFIIWDPTTNSYELIQNFLSGNLYEKIEEVKRLEDSQHKEYALKVLNEAKPKIVPYNDIRIQFGSRWIPINIVNDFVNEYYNRNFVIYSDSRTDVFFVKERDSYINTSLHKCKNARYIRMEDIIQNAYMDTYPIVTYSIIDSEGNKKTLTDVEATSFYKREIKKLQRAYENHLMNLGQAQKDGLEYLYNSKFRNTANVEFEDDLLDFSNMDLKSMGIDNVYKHQRSAIWKMLQNGGGVVDHEVGFGKTLTMIGLSYFMKEMGVAKKPIIIGLKANIAEIAATYKKMYYCLPQRKTIPRKSEKYF